MTINIGYYKMGRSMQLREQRFNLTAGDDEAYMLLRQLATRYPFANFHILGRNSGQAPAEVGLPANVFNPWASASKPKNNFPEMREWLTPQFRGMNYLVGWLGQHGSINTPMPKITDPSTVGQPLVSFLNYAGPIVTGINAWREKYEDKREEIWLNPDIRNTLKARDLKWPRKESLYAFQDYAALAPSERYGDRRDPVDCGYPQAVWVQGRWKHPDTYTESGLSVVSVPANWRHDIVGWEDRVRFGVLTSQQGPHPHYWRPTVFRDWVIPAKPDFFHGLWTQEGADVMGVPVPSFCTEDPNIALARAKSTFQTPTSGANWATPKAWEAFASGVVSFFHPIYDAQGHIIPTLDQVSSGLVESDELAKLALILRVQTPEQLEKRLDEVHQSRDLYEWIVRVQWNHWVKARNEQRLVRTLGTRMGLDSYRFEGQHNASR